jgi:hypothetical protein
MMRQLEAALGCSFREAEVRGRDVRLAPLLGMMIVLDEWRGINERPIFRMRGSIQGHLFTDASDAGDAFTFVDISQGIIDTLYLSDAGEWRVPSEAEREAELAWGKNVKGEH